MSTIKFKSGSRVNKTSVDIEVFTATVCSNCQRASHLVEELLKEPGFTRITWREVDVVAEIDYAVALGVLATPSISIGGAVAFTALPSTQQLRHTVQAYLANGKQIDE